VLPPGFEGDIPDGFYVVHSPTYSVTFAVRGFQVDGSTDAAVELMKQIKVYPLADSAASPEMEFLNGSGHDIDTLFPDDFGFFELLTMIVDEEPAEIFGPMERWLMQTIGIEKGTPFQPDAKAKAILEDAARLGGAMARANTYAPPTPDGYFYPDRKWQGTSAGLSYTFLPEDRKPAPTRNGLQP
jgi:hypothetical protein